MFLQSFRLSFFLGWVPRLILYCPGYFGAVAYVPHLRYLEKFLQYLTMLEISVLNSAISRNFLLRVWYTSRFNSLKFQTHSLNLFIRNSVKQLTTTLLLNICNNLDTLSAIYKMFIISFVTQHILS